MSKDTALSNIVVSLELARELKEVGYPQESLFYWEWTTPADEPYCGASVTTKEAKYSCKEDPHLDWLAAPTATELLSELPTDNDTKDLLTIHRHWQTKEFHVEYEDTGVFQRDKSLPNALAKMYIYLKKEGLLK